MGFFLDLFYRGAPCSNTVLLKFLHASKFLGARAAFSSAGSKIQ
jgi:hypothetical protein